MVNRIVLLAVILMVMLLPNLSFADNIAADWSFVAGGDTGSGTLTATELSSGVYYLTSFTGMIDGEAITLIQDSCGNGVVCNYLGSGTYDDLVYIPTVGGSYLDNAGILISDATWPYINLFANFGAPDIYGPCTASSACQEINMTPGLGNDGFVIATPEPPSLPLLAFGFIGLGLALRKRLIQRRDMFQEQANLR